MTLPIAWLQDYCRTDFSSGPVVFPALIFRPSFASAVLLRSDLPLLKNPMYAFVISLHIIWNVSGDTMDSRTSSHC